MPPTVIVGGEHYVFGSSGRPAVVHPSVNIFGVTREISVLGRGISLKLASTCHKYLSCEWEVMKRFSRSDLG